MEESKAYAKINLFLDIVGKRPDGYHDIRSLMHTVDLYDKVYVDFEIGNSPGITVGCNDCNVPQNEKNIAYKAAQKFIEKTEIGGAVRIFIDKEIPTEAGLAGGSADAAAVLRLMNKISGTPLTENELLKLGAEIGADVPFCIVGGSKITEGIGEKMTQSFILPDCYIVIARGGSGVSTPWAYGELDRLFGNKYPDTNEKYNSLLSGLYERNLGIICDSMYNVFEKVILPNHEIARYARETMAECDSIGQMMSGSGPSVFGIFDNEAKAKSCAEELRYKIDRVYVTTPIGETKNDG